MANPDVGTIFEVAINDVGYMLADTPDSEIQYRRVISTLEPQRFSSGETPVSEAVERYSFFNSSEWRGGAGQRFLNRDSSDKSSFWDRQGVDPFDEDQRLKLLPSMNLHEASSATNAMAVAGSKYMLLRDTSTVVKSLTLTGDTPATDQSYTTGLTSVTDMDLGPGKGYIATGTALREVTLGSATNNSLSTLDIHRVAWIGDRVAVLYRHSDAATWRFSTLDTSGTEEITDGLLTLPGATNASMASCDYKLGGMTSGNGYVWFSGWSADGDDAHVYVWNIDTTLSPSMALHFVRGEYPLDILYYQGGLYMWVVAQNEGVVKLYRGVVNGDGTITPFLVSSNIGTIPTDLEYDGPKMAVSSRSLFFCWNGMQTNSGFGVLDLATGGYAKRGHAGASGDAVSAYVWGNRPGVSVAGVGAYGEDSTDFETTGWLKTSIADADSALDKHWDAISFNATQGTGTSVTIGYTVDAGDSYTTLISASVLDEETRALDVDSPSLGMQITLTGNGTTTTPLFRVASVKFHPRGIIDQVLVFPINCGDSVKGLNGRDLGYTKNSGMTRARSLELLQGNEVTVQDMDWQTTAATYSMEVISVDMRRVRAAYDPASSENRTFQVAMVTLRMDAVITAATTPSNSAPVITDPGAQGDSVDVAITPVQFVATDSDGDSLYWGAKDLPAGLSMDQNGLVSGTPTTVAVDSVTIICSDGTAMDTLALTWTIT